MRLKIIFCLSLVLTVAGAAPGAQDKSRPAQPPSSLKSDSQKKTEAGERQGLEDKSDPDDEEVVRVETALVTSDVLVHDAQGKYVGGLGAGDFIITEDNQPQRISTFTLGGDVRRPRTIVLIIDHSGSQLPYIKTSVEAAKALMDQLNPLDLTAIVTDDVEVLADFTTDKAELKKKLDSLRKKGPYLGRLGRSRQYSALMATMNKLSAEERLRAIIIFQTDGDELSELRPVAAYPPPDWVKAPADDKGFSITDVSAAVLKSRATIYTVIPGVRFVGIPPGEQLGRAKTVLESEYAAVAEILRGPDEKRRPPFNKKDVSEERLRRTAEMMLWQQTALGGLAAVSGGWTDFLEEPGQAAELYGRILADINRRYVIGYQPTNKERDGKLRRVRIEVRGHPEYVVWGRRSYYAPERGK